MSLRAGALTGGLLGFLILGWAAASPAADRIRVALVADQPRVTISSATPLTVRPARGGAIMTRRARVEALQDGDAFDSGVVLVNAAAVAGPLTIAGHSSVEVDGVSYRGSLVVTPQPGGLLVVNDVDLESYVKSVVPSEVPPAWPKEALRAQAIIARTYALYHTRGAPRFDVVSSVQSQVYRGYAAENPRTSEAVDDTRGVIVRSNGRPAFTPYHSTSSGPTEDAIEVWGIDEPYLKGVECPFDEESAYHRWDRRFRFAAIESALRRHGYAIGHLATVTPLARNRSGRVSMVRLLHSEGELVLRGETLRRVLGYQALPSMRFDVVDVGWSADGRDAEVRIEGGGWGHGVGLCQWGMKTLAERGWTAERIIAYYYPGTSVDVR